MGILFDQFTQLRKGKEQMDLCENKMFPSDLLNDNEKLQIVVYFPLL